MDYSNYDDALYENRVLSVRTTKIPGMLIIDQVINVQRPWLVEGKLPAQRPHSTGLPRRFLTSRQSGCLDPAPCLHPRHSR